MRTPSGFGTEFGTGGELLSEEAGLRDRSERHGLHPVRDILIGYQTSRHGIADQDQVRLRGASVNRVRVAGELVIDGDENSADALVPVM